MGLTAKRKRVATLEGKGKRSSEKLEGWILRGRKIIDGRL